MKKKRRPENAGAEKKKWRAMTPRERLGYIADYYKFPILVFLILTYIAGYAIYGHMTKKETVLYTALVNVSAGDQLAGRLTEGFLSWGDFDSGSQMCQLYQNLYLTEDTTSETHEYVYASRMKLLGAIDGELLDVVIMNREAFDAFAQNGYLLNLEELLREKAPALYEGLRPSLVTNISILEDNAAELYFDSSLTYEAKTLEYPMALKLSGAPKIQEAGFPEEIYLGVLSNSPRREAALQYLEYLFS